MRLRRYFVVISLGWGLIAPASDLQGRETAPSSDAYASLVVLGAALAGASALSPPDIARWKGGIGLDGPVREALRLPAADSRNAVARLGDVTLGALLIYPYAIDGLWDLGAQQGREEAAWALSVGNTQALLVSGTLGLVVKNLVARERPYESRCAEEPVPECGSRYSRRSFFSGHAVLAFTGAGLVCGNRRRWELRGAETACPWALAAAGAVGMSRVLADRHYLSDVLVGAAVGYLSGYYVPGWLGADGGKEPPEGARSSGPRNAWFALPEAGGGRLVFVSFW